MSALAVVWVICGVTGAVAWAVVLLVGGLVAVLCALDKRDHRKRERRAAPAPVTDPFKVLVLTHACGPCTGVQGSRRCVCAGNCGHPKCKGRPVPVDMATALRRITEEGGGRG